MLLIIIWENLGCLLKAMTEFIIQSTIAKFYTSSKAQKASGVKFLHNN